MYPRSSYRRSRSGGIGAWVAVAVVVVVAFVIAIPACSSYFKHRNVAVTVTDKERTCKGGNAGCDYLIFTSGGTFKVGDSLVIGRFNSSDTYGQIERCHKYDLEVYGWRIGLTSSYPNVVKAVDKGRDLSCTVE